MDNTTSGKGRLALEAARELLAKIRNTGQQDPRPGFQSVVKEIVLMDTFPKILDAIAESCPVAEVREAILGDMDAEPEAMAEAALVIERFVDGLIDCVPEDEATHEETAAFELVAMFLKYGAVRMLGMAMHTELVARAEHLYALATKAFH
ncbi:MAG: hypothetical protein KatS3mg054_0156 [Chloroflexus sp.]|nr:MAG: hypothetical protein KatS3mg054_0156 [Chloroflexus sp.]